MPKGQFNRGPASAFVRGVQSYQQEHKDSQEHRDRACWHFTRKGILPDGTRRLRLSGGRKRTQVKINGEWRWEHRYLMEQHLGRTLSSAEVVHHVNSDLLDNRIENLVVVSQAEHIRLHLAEKGRMYYLVWRDAVGKPGYSTPEQASELASVLLRGVTRLIDENDTEIVVAHFVADDGGLMDTIAIPRKSIIKMTKVVSF